MKALLNRVSEAFSGRNRRRRSVSAVPVAAEVCESRCLLSALGKLPVFELVQATEFEVLGVVTEIDPGNTVAVGIDFYNQGSFDITETPTWSNVANGYVLSVNILNHPGQAFTMRFRPIETTASGSQTQWGLVKEVVVPAPGPNAAPLLVDAYIYQPGAFDGIMTDSDYRSTSTYMLQGRVLGSSNTTWTDVGAVEVEHFMISHTYSTTMDPFTVELRVDERTINGLHYFSNILNVVIPGSMGGGTGDNDDDLFL